MEWVLRAAWPGAVDAAALERAPSGAKHRAQAGAAPQGEGRDESDRVPVGASANAHDGCPPIEVLTRSGARMRLFGQAAEQAIQAVMAELVGAR